MARNDTAPASCSSAIIEAMSAARSAAARRGQLNARRGATASGGQWRRVIGSDGARTLVPFEPLLAARRAMQHVLAQPCVRLFA
jgi:hypothetical protein